MISPVFKAGDSVLRGSNGGFDSHTLPPIYSAQTTCEAVSALIGTNVLIDCPILSIEAFQIAQTEFYRQYPKSYEAPLYPHSTNNRYNLTFSVPARNIFKNVNLATPIGNLSSPLFGRSCWRPLIFFDSESPYRFAGVLQLLKYRQSTSRSSHFFLCFGGRFRLSAITRVTAGAMPD